MSEFYSPATGFVYLDSQSSLYACFHECMHGVQHRSGRKTAKALRAVHALVDSQENSRVAWFLFWLNTGLFAGGAARLFSTGDLKIVFLLNGINVLLFFRPFHLMILRWVKLWHEIDCFNMCRTTMLHLGKWDHKATKEAREGLLSYAQSRLQRMVVDRLDWTSPDVILLTDTKS